MSSPLHDDGPSAPPGHTEVLEAEPAAASGPLAGDPSILGLPTFIVGSVFLGLTLVGYTPAESVGSALPVLIFATGLGQLITTIWAAALGQSAVAAVFGIFTGFWLSYSALLVGLIHGWWGISADPIDTQTVPAFLISWLVVIGALTIFTLRLPAAFTAVFALVEVALALVLIGALSGETIFATLGGIAVFAFAAIGVYLFASAASLATGGPAMNLGKPIQH